MSGRVPHGHRKASQAKLLALDEEMIELRAVGAEVSAEVEQSLPGLLDFGDLGADADPGTQLPLQVRGSREMIGVRVRLEDPLDAPRRRGLRDTICRCRGRAGRLGVEVEDRIDDRRGSGRRVGDEIRDRTRRRVEEARDLRFVIRHETPAVPLATLY